MAYRNILGGKSEMPGLLQRLMPREEDFFVLFSKQADNIQLGAKALLQMLEHYTGVPEQVQSIKAIEHDGDDITHSIFTKLNQSFVTPFDREDIHELTSRLDDVASSKGRDTSCTVTPLCPRRSRSIAATVDKLFLAANRSSRDQRWLRSTLT